MKLAPVLAVLGSLDAIRAQFSRESVVAASPYEGGTAQSRFGFFRDGTPYVRASDSAKARGEQLIVESPTSSIPHTPSPSHPPHIFTKSSPSPVSNSIPLHPINGPVIGVLKFLALAGRDVARLMTWTSALAIGMILGGLTLVSPGFWRWIRRYAVRLTGALLILIGITSLAVCWMNALAANPTAAWFLHSSAVEEVGPWWMLLATVGVWAVLDVSRSYLPSLFTNHLRPWLTPFTMAPTIQTNSTRGAGISGSTLGRFEIRA